MTKLLKVTIVPDSADEDVVHASFVYKGKTYHEKVELEDITQHGDTPEAIRKKIEQCCQQRLKRIRVRNTHLRKALEYQTTLTVKRHRVKVRMVRIDLDRSDLVWEYLWRGKWYKKHVHYGMWTRGVGQAYGPEGLTGDAKKEIAWRTAYELKDILKDEERERKRPRQEMDAFIEKLAEP